MYGVPKDLNLTKALGSSITRIGIGKYDIHFNIGDVDFSIQSSVKLFKNRILIATWKEGDWLEKKFQELFNIDLINYTIPDDHTLILEFDENIELYLIEDDMPYESMQISIKGEQRNCVI
jgi:hypothetical protein